MGRVLRRSKLCSEDTFSLNIRQQCIRATSEGTRSAYGTEGLQMTTRDDDGAMLASCLLRLLEIYHTSEWLQLGTTRN